MIAVVQLESLHFFMFILFKSFEKLSISVKEEISELENALLQEVSGFPVPLQQSHLLFKFKSRHFILDASGSQKIQIYLTL